MESFRRNLFHDSSRERTHHVHKQVQALQFHRLQSVTNNGEIALSRIRPLVIFRCSWNTGRKLRTKGDVDGRVSRVMSERNV